MNSDSGIFTTKTSHRKFEDVVFDQPEVKAQNVKFNADKIHLTGRFESAEDIEIHARLAELESVLGYGSDKFTSNASNIFSDASYSRFATFA